MINKIRPLFFINSLGFSLYYLYKNLIIIISLLKIQIPLFFQYIDIFGFYLLLMFFILLTLEAYLMKISSGKIFAIIFLLFVGVLLIFPQFLVLNIMFLIIYSYYQSNRSKLTVPMSFITLGYFLSIIIPPVGFILLLYGWIKFLNQTRFRF